MADKKTIPDDYDIPASFAELQKAAIRDLARLTKEFAAVINPKLAEIAAQLDEAHRDARKLEAQQIGDEKERALSKIYGRILKLIPLLRGRPPPILTSLN